MSCTSHIIYDMLHDTHCMLGINYLSNTVYQIMEILFNYDVLPEHNFLYFTILYDSASCYIKLYQTIRYCTTLYFILCNISWEYTYVGI